MRALYDVLRTVELVTFVVLGILATREWLRHHTRSTAYMAAAFGLLGIVVLIGQFLPHDRTSALVLWATRLELFGIVLFPFFLYRFVTTLMDISRPVEMTAIALTAAVGAWSLAFPRLPAPSERPGWLVVYLLLLAVQWVFLSSQVVFRLYRAGTGQPATVRLRMRTLSMGSAGISIGLILVALIPETSQVSWVSIATEILAIASGPLFLLGFAPPRIVRTVWRQSESGSMRTTEASLMEALSPIDIARSLLPQAARLVGTEEAGLVNLDFEVIHVIGMSEQEAIDMATRASKGELDRPASYERHEIALRMSTAWLVLRASPFAPFFGETERELLQRVSVLGDLALERVQLLARELEHAEQLAEAQRLARIGSWEWDLETDEVTWSEQLYRNFGVDPEQYNLKYEGYLERVHPDDRDMLRDLIQEAIDNATGFETEQRQVRPDGSVIWTHARGRAITDETGRVVKFIGTSQDVTSRIEQDLVRLEQARSIEEQARMLDLAQDAIFVRDPGGKLRYWNQGAERLYGWAAEEVLGSNVNEVLRTEFPIPFEEILDQLIVHEHWEGELSHLRRNGERVVVNSRWALQRNEEGKPSGILELNTDITERKQQEEMRERFIADAAHELRTPLTTLLGFTEVLASSDRLGPEQTKMAFDAMGRAGKRMSALVNNLLDLSKLSAGRMALELGEVSAKEVVDDALADAPSPDGTRVSVHIADDVWIIGERERLSQVVANLLTNAYRYGGGNVAVTASRDDGEVALSISDDGEGVDPKLVPTVFEPFARSIESSQLGGSGLGLAIVRRLTEACGGSVTYAPSPDGGASFTLHLKAVT